MRLLAESTPEHRNSVRVLFYGQSITEQGWWKLVADDLRARFPNANLIIENRALGGFASQMLVKTAETDLYPFQPDLLIFHVYGAHDKYEDIIRRTRERTCAEILQQNDHVTKPEHLTEETDPAKVPIQSGQWYAFMNHNWLPSLARKYGTELCDQRALWKAYLRDYGSIKHGTQLGTYVVHYANGQRQEIPIRAGIDLADWWSQVNETDTQFTVAWTGTNELSLKRGRSIRLFKATWQNPHPDVQIAGIDFDFVLTANRPPSKHAAPFLVAITAEP